MLSMSILSPNNHREDLRVQLTNFFHHIDTLKKIDIKMDKCEVLTSYWLPKLHKIPINHASYKILATALLLLFQSILQPL